MNGTIKRIQADKGFGFVRTQAGVEYFFHRSACTGAGGFDGLHEGDKVSFDEENSPKGPRASNVRAV